MRAEVAEHLRSPKEAEALSPEEIDRRHAAADARLAREVDEVADVLNPLVTTYDGPPTKALQPVQFVNGEEIPEDKTAERSRFEQRIGLVWASVSRSPITRIKARRTLRRRRRELFPEDFR